MGPSNRNEGKMGVGDIVFLIILVVIIIFLIPFYSSIFEILKLAAQFMVGADTYIGLLGCILGLFMLSLGLKHKNNAIKIFGILLAVVFLLNPFYAYLGDKKLLKKSLGKYSFKGVTVIQPNSCQLEEEVQNKVVDTWNQNFGTNDLDVDSIESTPLPQSNASWKEKLRCMPIETHYVYKISYKDAFDENRIIYYDTEESFDDRLKVQSYEILYEKIGDYFKEKPEIGKVNYQFKVYGTGKGLLSVDRSSVVSENISLPTPNNITLKNFYQDSRLVLEINFQNLPDKNKIYSVIKELEEQSERDFPVVIYYGSSAEYYLRGIWYPFREQEFAERLVGIN